MRQVRVVDYQSSWMRAFEAEAEKIRRLLGEKLVSVHHIGSTSVPGLKAKPILDLMPVVKKIIQVDDMNPGMRELGYEPKGENGIPGRRFFMKGGDDRTHHIHVFQQGSPHVDRHLAFRDYLRSHPSEADRYGALKEELARRFPTDIEAYIQGKSGLICEIEAKALVWYRGTDEGQPPHPF